MWVACLCVPSLTHRRTYLEPRSPAGEASQTALATAGASDARIQAMLRWASEDALLLYRRTDESEYASWVHVAGHTSFSTIRSQHLPGHATPPPDLGAAQDAGRAEGIRIDCDDMAALGIQDAAQLLAEASLEDAQ